MITQDGIVQLLRERHVDGKPDPLEVVCWEPFTLQNADGSWTGRDVPAGMILAKVILAKAAVSS